MRQYITLPAVAALTIALSGCLSHQVREEIDVRAKEARTSLESPAITNTRATSQANDRLYIPVRRVVSNGSRSAWLVGKPLTVDLDSPVPLPAVMRMISEQGVNIVSDLPLDGYTWSGRINQADTETALRMILGGVGLDYDIDDERRLVTVRPVRSKTWTLNLGNRRTTYAAGGASSGSLSDSDTDVTAAGAGGVGTVTNVTSSSGSNGNSGTTINSDDDFWKSLREELDNRLQIRLPAASGQGGFAAAAQPGAAPAPAGAASSVGQGDRSWIGTYSVNPETGAITVSAPHWILSDLDKYMTRVQAMYNAEITFTGELLMVTRSRNDSEGLDVSTFGNFAKGRYGAVLQNNALGGVTLSFPSGANGLANVVAGQQPVPGALLGVASPADALQIFNAWLSEVGRVSVVQKPIISTTSGVPGQFRKKRDVYFNLVSQETASGGVGGAVSGTRNTLQSKGFGTQLTINPRYDYSTGLIRAQIALEHIVPTGTQLINQTINSGDSFETIPTRIPLGNKIEYSGEALLRDGDLVVIGGQSEETDTLSENGLPGVKGAISGIFGTKNVQKEAATYYFALRVSIKAR